MAQTTTSDRPKAKTAKNKSIGPVRDLTKLERIVTRRVVREKYAKSEEEAGEFLSMLLDE